MKIGIAGPVSLDLLRSRLSRQPPSTYSFPLIGLIVDGLLRRGHEVHVFALSRDVAEPTTIEGDRTVIHIGRYRARHRARDLFAQERQDLLSAMKRSSCDVIHAHWTYEFALAALASNLPTVVTAHDAPFRVLRMIPSPYRAARLLMALAVARRARHLTAVSPYVARHFRRLLLSRANPVVIPNGLPDRVFQLGHARSLPETPPRVITALSGWGSLKNGAGALRAFALFRQRFPDATLSMYGHGHGRGDEAEVWALRHRLAAGVTFAGEVSHDELLRIMANSATLLLHPTLEEAHPVTICEAMAVGLPVVAGRASGGVPWTLDEGRCGVLVDVNSPEDMSAGMAVLSSNPIMRAELVDAASKRARTLFHLERMLDHYEDQYRNALST